MKTVIITGSRHYKDIKPIRNVMRALLEEFGIYKFRHGKAKGADSLGAFVAQQLKLDIDEYIADWDQYGNAAGPIRNREMLLTEIEKEGKENIIVIAFPLEGSKGTYDMINFATGEDVEVRIYNDEGKEVY
jgi:hypothetical protein